MRASRSRGQNLVEFGLVLPILIITMLGITDFGLTYFIRGSVDNAAREGARYASVRAGAGGTGGASMNVDNVKTQVINTVTGVSLSPSDITVSCCDDTNTCVTAPDPSCVPPNRVKVNVQYRLTTFWPGPASGTYQTSSTMRFESSDQPGE